MLRWNRPDLLEHLEHGVDLEQIRRLREELAPQLELQKYKDMAQPLDLLPTLSDLDRPPEIELDNDVVKIGNRHDLSDEQYNYLEQAILALRPWRKGPFQLFGYQIDAEWRSNLKWNRIKDALGDLRSRRILDVGCGNGYYMLRAAASNPQTVIGLDPSIQFYYAFELFRRFLPDCKLQYERLGAEHLYVFDQAFDIAMCMGVLYHRKNPIEILNGLRNSIRVGGFAIIESQTIPGDSSTALFPESRYAKARNVFFVPTKDCLINWVKRSGFKEVELIDHSKVTVDEQRTTALMNFESLTDFLDPNDDRLTIEGYPAPYRTVVKGVRKHL